MTPPASPRPRLLGRLAGLAAPELGLSGEDAAARRERYGDNHIVETLEAG